jgi:hypothetical protein
LGDAGTEHFDGDNMSVDSLARDVVVSLDEIRHDAQRRERLLAARTPEELWTVACTPSQMIECFRGWLHYVKLVESAINQLQQPNRQEHLLVTTVVEREVREGLLVCEELAATIGEVAAGLLNPTIVAIVAKVREHDQRLGTVRDRYRALWMTEGVGAYARQQREPQEAASATASATPDHPAMDRDHWEAMAIAIVMEEPLAVDSITQVHERLKAKGCNLSRQTMYNMKKFKTVAKNRGIYNDTIKTNRPLRGYKRQGRLEAVDDASIEDAA